MTTIVRPGKYIIEKTRRSLVGVVARVGTGGSVPKVVQEAIDTFVDSTFEGRGGDVNKIRETEKQVIRQGMKQMQGAWVILSAAGLSWVSVGAGEWEKEIVGIQRALKPTGWMPPRATISQLVFGPDPGEPGVKRVKYASSKKK